METESLTMDAEESAMRDLGHQADAEQGREPVEQSAPPPEQEPALHGPNEQDTRPQTEQPETEQPPESPQPELTQEQQLGRDIKTGQFKKAERPETEYSRAQKEAARKDRSWQALQAEKEQFRMMQTQWEEGQRMAQLEAARQNYAPLKKEGLTAQQYAEGARRFEQEGELEIGRKDD